MSTPAAMPHIAFDNTVGAELIGVLISVLLLGIFLMQVYVYFQTFGDDVAYLKYMVYVITVLTILSTIFLCHGIYYYTVTNYVNPLSLLHDIWSFTYVPIPDIILISMIEFFFAMRVYRLSGHQKKLLVLILLLSVISNATKLVAMIEAITHSNTGDHPGKNQQIPAFISLATTALCDCVIAVLQTYYLHRGRTGIKRTDHIINTLIAYSVSTGVITSITALFGLGFFAAFPNNTIFWAFISVSSGTYSNALLASLNGRQNFKFGESTSNSIALTSLDVASRSENPPAILNNKRWMDRTLKLNSTKKDSISKTETSRVDDSASDSHFEGESVVTPV